MKLTIWEKKEETTIYVGGDPNKGEAPFITIQAKDPQVFIDDDKGYMVIKETK